MRPERPGRAFAQFRHWAGKLLVTAKLLEVAAALVVPVLWGILVNWLFNRWQDRKLEKKQNHEPFFPDYQI